MIRRPPRSTRTDTRFPYTTLFRSSRLDAVVAVSDGAARGLEAVSGLPDGTVRTIHNPIVGATRTPVSAATQPDGWVRGSHKRVLAVGTLKEIGRANV